MMKTILVSLIVLGFLFPPLTVPAMPSVAPGAPQSPFGQPPAENPHPPSNAEDQRRVDFAVQQIIAGYGPQLEIKYPHIIPWSFEKFKNTHRRSTPKAAASKVAPMAPVPLVQKSDEYIIHAYVKFPDNPRWHHLDVIIAEDESGNLAHRRFYSVPIPPPSQKLPMGIVC